MNEKIEIKCPAKINLSLDVVNRREDGYHNLEMIMHQVDLCDTLTLKPTDEGIFLSSDAEGLSVDGSNLIVKAAKLFFEKTKIKEGIKIHLEKRIPMGAGLGGGSTDAAGTLMALNQIFGEPLTLDELAPMAKDLGADVPFFLSGGCMLAEGIGEKLTPLTPLTGVHIVIAKPPVHVSTAYVYKNLVLDENTPHPDTRRAVEALMRGDAEMLGKYAGNVLETVTATEYPVIEEYKKTMTDCGAIYSLMSGSGSAVFGIFKSLKDAQKAMDIFPEAYIVV